MTAHMTASPETLTSIVEPEARADADPGLVWKDLSGMEQSALFGAEHLADIIRAIDALGTVEVFYEKPDPDERRVFIRGTVATGYTLEVADWLKAFPMIVGRREPENGPIRLVCDGGSLEVTVRSSQVLTSEEVVEVAFEWMLSGFHPSRFRLSELADRSHHIVGK